MRCIYYNGGTGDYGDGDYYIRPRHVHKRKTKGFIKAIAEGILNIPQP